jgi:hypothetical protein
VTGAVQNMTAGNATMEGNATWSWANNDLDMFLFSIINLIVIQDDVSIDSILVIKSYFDSGNHDSTIWLCCFYLKKFRE